MYKRGAGCPFTVTVVPSSVNGRGFAEELAVLARLEPKIVAFEPGVRPVVVNVLAFTTATPESGERLGSRPYTSYELDPNG